jgi:hypothetical protein
MNILPEFPGSLMNARSLSKLAEQAPIIQLICFANSCVFFIETSLSGKMPLRRPRDFWV